jgi:hypothetical protein
MAYKAEHDPCKRLHFLHPTRVFPLPHLPSLYLTLCATAALVSLLSLCLEHLPQSSTDLIQASAQLLQNPSLISLKVYIPVILLLIPCFTFLHAFLHLYPPAPSLPLVQKFHEDFMLFTQYLEESSTKQVLNKY